MSEPNSVSKSTQKSESKTLIQPVRAATTGNQKVNIFAKADDAAKAVAERILAVCRTLRHPAARAPSCQHMTMFSGTWTATPHPTFWLDDRQDWLALWKF